MKYFVLTISFLLCFFLNTAIAQTLPNGVVLPENISDVECFVNPPNQSWSIAYSKSQEINLSPYQNPVIGDIDGDGIVEILLCADPVDPSVALRHSNKIAIYKGNNIQAAPKIITTQQDYSWDAYTKYAIVKTKIASKDTVLIVVAERDCYLRAYNYNGGLVWTSNQKYMTTFSSPVTISFGDLNSDGIPEVLISNKVYDSSTGTLLCQTPIELKGYSTLSIPLVEDIYLEGKPRVIQGNMIYQPNQALTSLTLEKKISANVNASDPDKPAAALTIPDGGRSVIVDMDLDGNPELVVSVTVNSYTFIYIADPVSGVVKGSKVIPNATNSSYPFIGDIDGDGYPEIVFITNPGLKIYAYKFVSGNPILQKFWELPHTDTSGLTAMTLFDFNQDGISEIVYRDEKKLRIINGSLIHHQTGATLTAPYNLADYDCTSGTSTEYPVVADIDNDGQAEIVIVGGDNRAPAGWVIKGCLWVFKSGDLINAPWASARSVWNQYAYNSLNVNDDLSIPKVPMSPGTRFAGADGILGNGDDVRPFNNFLQQQTSLNKNGTPLWLAANAQIAGTPNMSYNEATDVMTVTVKVKNKGEVAFQNPFYITVYKDNVGNSRKHTYKYEGMIGINAEVDITFDIPNYQANWSSNNGVVIKLNDIGDGLFQQPVCDSSKDQFVYYGLIPTSLNICVNDVKTLECNFTIPGGTNSYQWQSSSNDMDWTDIAGATSNNFTVLTTNRGICYYRVVVKAGANTEYSNSVKVKVNSCSLPVNHNISNMEY